MITAINIHRVDAGDISYIFHYFCIGIITYVGALRACPLYLRGAGVQHSFAQAVHKVNCEIAISVWPVAVHVYSMRNS